jgi:hypothetical protein
MRPLARELAHTLWDEGVLIDNIWFSVVNGTDYVCMRALCSDEDDGIVECCAIWGYDFDLISDPFAQQWELVEVELMEPLPGLVSND